MQFRTTRREVAGHRVLALDGAADLAALPQLRAACQRLVSDVAAGSSIAIDLDDATIVDDAALGLLLGAAATVRSRHATLRIVCADERLRRRLADTRFDRAVDVVASFGELVATSSSELSQNPLLESRGAATVHPMNERDELLHIALPDDWSAARALGEYRVSTRGRSLDDQGFIHCSYPRQIEGVANRFYGDVAELVLLHLDPELIEAEIRVEPAAEGGTELFPHVYGPIPTSAVLATTWWDRDDDGMWHKPVTM